MRDLNGLPPSQIGILTKEFREAMVRANRIFGRRAFRKFTSASRRGPVNKALFESWANVLQQYDLEALRQRKDQIVKRVSDMFELDSDYVRSLSAGTGSVKSVNTRFERAHQSIQEVLK
jgi:hypothetical protein